MEYIWLSGFFMSLICMQTEPKLKFINYELLRMKPHEVADLVNYHLKGVDHKAGRVD